MAPTKLLANQVPDPVFHISQLKPHVLNLFLEPEEPPTPTSSRKSARSAAPARERRVVRRSRLSVKPMGIEEAALFLEDSEQEFLVFRDSSTEKVSVLYKRPDGNLGLIEC